MDLFIMRHGQAHPDATNDAVRQLTDHGREATALVIQKTLLKKKITLSKIIASPYIRAQQTAEIAKQVLKFSHAIEITDYLLPDADSKTAFDFITTQKTSAILLVSHQPLVDYLLNLLEHGVVGDQHVPTSGLSHIKIDQPLMIGCGVLQWSAD